MRKTELLQTYRSKRDFARTPEPGGKSANAKTPARRTATLHFVIQKHDASRLHYDFRLEADGVLKSWAVPKGPSTHPSDKRLAVMTEDHPVDYAGFEGVIPEGGYGGGPVIVWDRGRYVNLTLRDGKVISLFEGIRRGHIQFWLEGEKLHGAWSLIRLRSDKQWLLIKQKDEGADFPPDPVHEEPASVLSGRRIEELTSHIRAPAKRA